MLLRLAKSLLPTATVDWLRSRNAAHRGNWRGIYPRLIDVPVLNPEFGDSLINEMAESAQWLIDQARQETKPYLWHEALGLVAGCLCAKQDKVTVLDFGGGLGTGYLQLQTSLPVGVALDYRVIDNERMCERGRSLFQGNEAIRFSTALPAREAFTPDIVYVNSVLQYIEDYAAQLRTLAAFGASHLLLARLAAGNCPAFAAAQVNVPGQVLPYWFLNAGEVTAILQEIGYRLVCDELTERFYDQSAYPATHRVERFRDMLFVRASVQAA